MKIRIEAFSMACVLSALLVVGCARQDSHKHWPKRHVFMDQEVEFRTEHRTGDYDTHDTVPGQKPATIQTYYVYVKDGKEVRHGKYTAWYAEGKPKAETTFVHGRKQDRTVYFYAGAVAEKVKVTPGGSEAWFYDKQGQLVGRQLYNKKTDRRTYLLADKIVPENDFMHEIARRVYGVTRIEPH